MVVKIRKRLDGINVKVRDQSRFAGIRFGDEHPLVSIGAGCCRHRKYAARVTDNTIKRKFTDDESVVDDIAGQMTGEDNDAKRDGKIVGRSFFADGCRGQVDDNTVTRKM